MERRAWAFAAATAVVALALPVWGSPDYSIAVDVWTDRAEDFFYLPGDPLRVYFRPEEDCYLVLYQIDTDGNVFLLFPAAYGRAFFARGGITYCVNDFFPDLELEVFGSSGVGYIAVLASPVPFRVPRWLRPHPVFRGWVTVYSPWYYERIVEEPYVAICQINARIVKGWGVGLRLGAGYCWFYVERCYVPVYPIWHPRYWEVRVVTRPLYDRVWAHHDHFYHLSPRKHDHPSGVGHAGPPPTRRPFERPREFRASPAPEMPAWVREAHADRAVQVGYREGSRQRVARPSGERMANPTPRVNTRTPYETGNDEAWQSRSRRENESREAGRTPRAASRIGPRSSASREDVRPPEARQGSDPHRQRKARQETSFRGETPLPAAAAPPRSNRGSPVVRREAKPQTDARASLNRQRKSPGEAEGAVDSRRAGLRVRAPRL